MVSEVLIADEKSLEEVKKKITEDRKEKFHVLADFDNTLTKTVVEGRKVPSIISVLRDRDYLTLDYPAKAKALFEKYHPIEINHNISIKEKKVKMHEWWTTHFDLLIKSGLNKKDLESVVEEGLIQFRSGVLEFLDFLYNHKIPLVIMSSSGLGDAIPIYLEKHNRLYDNIHIISNLYEWNSDGRAIRVKEPIIHSMNKDETAIQNYPVFEIIKNRKNVLLIGDSLNDIGMVKGFDYEKLIKIGFLNENVKENLKKYQENFDVVITEDGSFDYINKLVKDILK